jgi:uncharacterized RDD family membrane protein YckC
MCPVLDEVDPRTFRTAWRRLVAISIDLLVVTGMELLLLTALRIPWSHVGEALFDRRVGVLDAVVGFAYPIVLHRLFGQTLGKWVTRVRLVARDLGPITWIQAVFRETPWIVSLILRCAEPSFFLRRYGPDDGAATWFPWQLGLVAAWVTVDLIAMLSTTRRRALHDFLARTVVVRLDKGSAFSSPMRRATTVTIG